MTALGVVLNPLFCIDFAVQWLISQHRLIRVFTLMSVCSDDVDGVMCIAKVSQPQLQIMSGG